MDLGISDLKKLTKLGQFHALGHRVANNSESCDDCSNCYSGDTEYEMGGGGSCAEVLAEVWMKAATNLGLSTRKYREVLKNSDDESSEDAEEGEDE